MIFFEPTDKFHAYFAEHPWKWKKFHDCGAGAGHLTRLMRERGRDCTGYDLYPRGCSNEAGASLHLMDTTSDAFECEIEVSDVILIARPCHGTDWVKQTIRKILDIGDAFYIGLQKNIEDDLGELNDLFYYEIVETEVGKEGEVLIRVYSLARSAKILRYIRTREGREEWWWYRAALDRYVSSPDSLSGFDAAHEEVLQELKRGNELQHSFAKADLCNDTLDTGWIAPDGEFFGCDYCDHDRIMRAVVGISVRRAEELGFVRAHGTEHGSGSWTMGWDPSSEDKRRPTPAQAKMLSRKGYKVVLR